MVGARAIAFPRLIAFGYWMFLFGGIFLYVDVRAEHRARTPAGSATRRSPGRSSAPASAPTSGRS